MSADPDGPRPCPSFAFYPRNRSSRVIRRRRRRHRSRCARDVRCGARRREKRDGALETVKKSPRVSSEPLRGALFSHRVRCGGGGGGRRARPRGGAHGRGPGARDGRPAARRVRPGRGARVHGHGVVGPAGPAEGPADRGRRHPRARRVRAPARPSRGVPGRAVRVAGAVHAAGRVAHVVPDRGRRVVRPHALPPAAGRVPKAGVPATRARPDRRQHRQAAVRGPAKLSEAPDAVPGQPERGLSVSEHLRAAR